jgi:hypothetical protein
LVEDNLKLKSAVGLLYLFLFVSAVDTIPDPPAIQPSGRRGYQICSFHVRGPISSLEKAWVVACNWPGRALASSLSFRPAFLDKAIAVLLLPRIHHVTDSSPPVFS